MTTEEFLKVIEEWQPPFTLRTRGGQTYVLQDRKHFWVPPSWEHTVILALPNKGVKCLDIGAIDEVGVEHETADR